MQKKTLSLVVVTLLSQNLFSFESLEPIVVNASKTEQSIKDITSKVTIITAAELEEKHINTLLDALRISNISIAQYGSIGQTSSFFLNGFSAGNTLVLIDGISYNDPTTTEGQAQLEHLMISDIEQIEIIEGAQSGIWGANAVAGVINIVTKKATSKLQTHANVEYGSHNSQKYSTSISQKVDKFSYYLGLNYLKTDGISAKASNIEKIDDYEDDGYKNRSLNAKLGYEITHNDEINFNITDIDAKVEYDTTGANDISSSLTQNNHLYLLGYTHKFSQDLSSTLSYEKSLFHKENSSYKGESSKYALSTKFDYISDSFMLFGAEKKESKDVVNIKYLENRALFLTNSNKFNQLIFTQSLRKDWFDKFSDKSTGKIGAKYNFSDDLSLSTNYGSAYKVPSLDQQYGKYFDSWFTNSWVVYGSQNLKPENTKSFDFTIKYAPFSATYFNNKTEDLIEYKNGAFTQLSGTSTFKGYELSYKDEVMSDLALGVAYKKLSAKDKDNKDLIRRAKSSLSASADYYGISKTHLGFYANHIGSRDDVDYSTWPSTQTQTGRYTLLNTVINYEIDDKFSIYAKGDNLGNKLYQEITGYGTYGRTFSVGLNGSF